MLNVSKTMEILVYLFNHYYLYWIQVHFSNADNKSLFFRTSFAISFSSLAVCFSADMRRVRFKWDSDMADSLSFTTDFDLPAEIYKQSNKARKSWQIMDAKPSTENYYNYKSMNFLEQTV